MRYRLWFACALRTIRCEGFRLCVVITAAGICFEVHRLCLGVALAVVSCGLCATYLVNRGC